MPMAATAISVTVEYVRGSFGADTDGVESWPVRRVYGIPARIIGSRVGDIRAVARTALTHAAGIGAAVARTTLTHAADA